jgi:hypothetical protein
MGVTAEIVGSRVNDLRKQNVHGAQLADEMRYQFLSSRVAATNRTSSTVRTLSTGRAAIDDLSQLSSDLRTTVGRFTC